MRSNDAARVPAPQPEDAAVAVDLIPCTIDDVEELNAIGAATFTETHAEYNSAENLDSYIRRAFTPDVLAGELANPKSHFFFARVGDETAGYLKVNTEEAQNEAMGPDALEVERVYILRKCKGLGIGRAMIEKAIDEARTRGLGTVWLGVWEHNRQALAFYEHMGFAVFGSHVFTVGDDDQTDLLMRLRVA